jgi:hypothetical protein
MSHDCLEASRSEICGRRLRAGDWATGCSCLPAGGCLRLRVGAGECGRAGQTHSLGIECGVANFFSAEVSVMSVRSEVLWETGKEAWTKLRELQVEGWRMNRTGYAVGRVADRICEFCLALLAVQKRGDDAVEVPEWAEKLAEAIAALEKLRVLLSLVGKPESICLTTTEVQELQKQLRDYAERLKE